MLPMQIYDKSNPLRPVDWRHRRACQLLDQNQHAARWIEDPATQNVYRFLRRRRLCRTEGDLLHLAQSMPEASAALEIYEHPDSAMRAGVEARLLAGQSAREIAARAGVTWRTVEFYAAAFFDVQDRLHARDFIFNRVIAASRTRKEAYADRDADWKFFAYMGGPDLLESIMYGAPLPDGPINRRDLAKSLAENTDVIARQGVAEKLKSSAPKDLQLAGQLQRLCGKTGTTTAGEEGQLDEYHQSVAALVEGLPLRVHRPGISDDDIPEEIKRFEEKGITLRANELLLYGINGTLPNVEALATAKFPESK
ncbi:MAG: hypothetical protein HQ567_07675 [Candidatus Nealsonbacteria bacterium]|nr:hypothetical protein [Candidatus Nealsonbacteria bacterium]